MAKKKKQREKVTKYPKQYQFSIGIVIIGTIFIYMVYHLITYITADNITIYEVSQGSITSNLEYNALAIRNETVYTAELSGKVLYLAENFGRVGVKSNVYAVDQSGDIVTSVTSTSLAEANIDKKDLNDLNNTISSYSLDYSPGNFYKVYSFKTELDSQLNQLYNLSAMDAMEEAVNVALANGSFHIYKATSPGLVVYSTDGLENLTVENFTTENFDANSIKVTNLKSQQSVETGSPVYKVVNSDYWHLVCEVNEEVYNHLSESNYLEIEFLQDEKTTWTSCSFEERYGKYYVILTLDDSMPRYADSRFIHIKILDKDITGLKIPNSSIVEKEFFTIPKAYFYQGNNGSAQGLNIQVDANTNNFVTPTIYYETDDYYYVDQESVHSGDILIKSNSSDKYIVGSEVGSLKGVYNVNKGYTVFKQIEIVYKNADYSIIKTGTDYGIAMYDHIVLQGDEVSENSIIN